MNFEMGPFLKGHHISCTQGHQRNEPWSTWEVPSRLIGGLEGEEESSEEEEVTEAPLVDFDDDETEE